MNSNFWLIACNQVRITIYLHKTLNTVATYNKFSNIKGCRY